ncbi:adenylosuccinate lyase [Sphingobacteriales bacterium UPWRP_1]|nr:adenylosuccinate lyase [Sphingobacteriales bacterium TSM_CSM]PSJ74168.1 adenylosuccinate lyase [Sphingobacteriales bacterium UPWRP_1]
MSQFSLYAISPLDGRYRQQVAELAPFFSEWALMKYRVRVEVEYFIALCRLPLPALSGTDESVLTRLRGVYQHFSDADALQIKETEATINHDVKAVEYFLKQQLQNLNMPHVAEFVHFGLTSQDINNTATPLLLKEALQTVLLPQLTNLLQLLHGKAKDWLPVAMLARTHGQPASPTLLGKEILVFTERLQMQLQLLQQIPHSAKFGGAVGNFNAHHAAYPNINWLQFADDFVASLGLQRSRYTTQIEHYDNLSALFDALKRINTILIDLCRDMWTYISMDYFKQQIVAGEVGSSTMPHKVNPIDFENAEGNLGIANALFEHLSAKLPISRLQRDLTDSTVLRNIGVPVAHTLLAIKNLKKGLNKLMLNSVKIEADLDAHWEVITEGIQTILRREGYPQPYEALKNLSRTNQQITHETLVAFIDSLQISPQVKHELLALNPFNYTGVIYPPPPNPNT